MTTYPIDAPVPRTMLSKKIRQKIMKNTPLTESEMILVILRYIYGVNDRNYKNKTFNDLSGACLEQGLREAYQAGKETK